MDLQGFMVKLLRLANSISEMFTAELEEEGLRVVEGDGHFLAAQVEASPDSLCNRPIVGADVAPQHPGHKGSSLPILAVTNE